MDIFCLYVQFSAYVSIKLKNEIDLEYPAFFTTQHQNQLSVTFCDHWRAQQFRYPNPVFGHFALLSVFQCQRPVAMYTL